MFVREYMFQRLNLEVRGVEIGSLLPHQSGDHHQIWWQAPLPIKPPFQLLFTF